MGVAPLLVNSMDASCPARIFIFLFISLLTIANHFLFLPGEKINVLMKEHTPLLCTQLCVSISGGDTAVTFWSGKRWMWSGEDGCESLPLEASSDDAELPVRSYLFQVLMRRAELFPALLGITRRLYFSPTYNSSSTMKLAWDCSITLACGTLNGFYNAKLW